MKTQTLLVAALLATAVSGAVPAPPMPVIPVMNPPARSVASFQWVHAHRQGRDIVVSWIMGGSAAPVVAYTVIKTYEDPTDPYAVWTTVATVTNTSPRMFRVTDNSVLPGYNSYRVVASLADGSTEYSEVRTVRVVQH